jgi:hypothetical protein
MKSIKPRDYKTTNAIMQAKKPFLPGRLMYGKEIPAFNGSQNNRKNKKRPITLPKIDN